MRSTDGYTKERDASAASTEASTLGLRQIPFACAYSPGRGQVHLVFWITLLLLLPVTRAIAGLFHRGLTSPIRSLLMIALLVVVRGALMRRGRTHDPDAPGLVFAGEVTEDLQTLRLG